MDSDDNLLESQQIIQSPTKKPSEAVNADQIKTLEKIQDEDENNSQIDPVDTRKESINEPFNYDKLLEDRQILRNVVVVMFSQGLYAQSILPIQKLIKVSKKLAQLKVKAEDVLEYVADSLLLVKALIRSQNIQLAREQLVLQYDYLSKNTGDQQHKNKALYMKQCNLLALIANLFYSIGDQRFCENAYVKYVLTLQACYGEESLEASNGFFLMGVYYLQHKYLTQALACFKQALQIRTNKIGGQSESIADCW